MLHKYLCLFSFFACALFACQSASVKDSNVKKVIQGKTMGTTYNITYYTDSGDHLNLQKEVDKLLVDINMGVSTYIPTSTIGLFNEAESSYCLDKIDNQNIHFINNYEASQIIAQSTNNAFDPTIMPLVNYWGFGYKEKVKVEAVDSTLVKEKLSCVGIEKVTMAKDKNVCFSKQSPCNQLDFSAIAKGYAVDKISELLYKKGYHNHLVEIGGELVALGTKPNKSPWVAGINSPIENSPTNHIEYKLSLENKALATSGNYRNFYKSNGHTYSHTINPETGYPERSNLLSATVIAPNCMISDATATSYMTMGLEKALAHVNKDTTIEAFFIYLDDKDQMKSIKSNNFQALIQ